MERMDKSYDMVNKSDLVVAGRHTRASLPLLPLELQIIILSQIPPVQIFTLQRVSRAWHTMLGNPSLQSTINDQIPFLTSASSLASRLKRRMRVLRGKPVWVKSFHEVFPDFDREPGRPIGCQAQQWVRYAGNGYMVAVAWGDAPPYPKRDSSKHTCDVPHEGSEFRPNPVTAGKRMLKIGHVKSAHTGKDLIEVDLFEVIEKVLPEVYKEWVIGQGHMDEPVHVFSLITQYAMDRQIVPYHLHVDDGLVVVGLRTQKPWPLRRCRTRDWSDDHWSAAKSYDGVRCCGDYYFVFSLQDGSLQQHMYVAPMYGDGSFKGDDHLVLSQVNPSTLFLLYKIRAVDPPEPIVEDGYNMIGKLPNWITKHLRLLTFDMCTGKSVGPELLLKELGNSEHKMEFPRNPEPPRCLLGHKGEVYLPLKCPESKGSNYDDVTADFESSHVFLVARDGDQERTWTINKLPRACLAGEEFAIINPRQLGWAGNSTSNSSTPHAPWEGIKDLLTTADPLNLVTKSSPQAPDFLSYDSPENHNRDELRRNKIPDLEMFHAGDSPHQDYPTSSGIRSRKVLAHIGTTACSVLYPPYSSNWSSMHPNQYPRWPPLETATPGDAEPTKTDNKTITFYKWQIHSPNSTIRKYTLTVPQSLPYYHLGCQVDGWTDSSNILKNRYYCQCGSSQCVSRKDNFVWGYHVLAGWERISSEGPQKKSIYLLPYPKSAVDNQDDNNDDENKDSNVGDLAKHKLEEGWVQRGNGIVGDTLREMVKLVDTTVTQQKYVGFSFLWGDDGIMAWVIRRRGTGLRASSRMRGAIVLVCWDDEWAF